ncbi:MAG TPA: flavin reductase family protein, partial [Candidatus Limnocylindrales bacterium]|nr:flavin reductase family protein [Candidatus Limnocylindrales bacterium]
MRSAPAPPGEAPPAVDATTYRDVLGRFVTGVTVVTCLDDAGDRYQPWGTTVNAFTSVSLDPPLVLVCIGRERSIHPIVARTGRFVVNILDEDSPDLSDCFSGAPSTLPREAFCDAPWRASPGGLPVLEAAVAHLECSIERTLDGGDHTIYLARVVGLGLSEVHPLPLLYYRGRYLRIERAATAALQ